MKKNPKHYVLGISFCREEGINYVDPKSPLVNIQTLVTLIARLVFFDYCALTKATLLTFALLKENPLHKKCKGFVH